jgi:HD superfamily phosphodiesterase
MLIAPVREHVFQACQRKENIFGASFFAEHLELVSDVGRRLAGGLGADSEAVELAACLHDLSAVCDPATLPEHARASAGLARTILAERGWPEETVRRVADAIASHSAPLQIGSASPEAVCLSNADAAARILRPTYWLYFAFKVRGLGFEEGRRWLRSLIESQWSDLIEPAKELVGERYLTAIELLRD